MMPLQDICREAKERKKLTNQDVADKSDVNISTVNNFFSSASKSPSVYTVGPICAVLGVSLDRIFEIVPDDPGDEPTPSERELMERQLKVEREKQALLERSVKTLRRFVFGLIVAVALIAMYAVTLDICTSTAGIFRG